jgi:lysophospholipase L1-like esterase
MRRTILWVTEARAFIVVGFGVILAFILWVGATAPPSTKSANAASAQNIDYFALGDSVASGHGLRGAAGDCLRSSLAYPYTVRDALKTRYKKVNFPTHKAADGSKVRYHLACSGATAGVPNTAVPKGSYKWLRNQVNYTVNHLSADRLTLVSITIGANDFDFSNIPKMKKLLKPKEFGGSSDAEFNKWLEETAVAAENNLKPQVERLLQKPKVVVVITDYYDPMNKKSKWFVAWPEGALSQDWCLTCRPRWEHAITRLNQIFVNVRSDLKNPPRLQLTGDRHPKVVLPIRGRYAGPIRERFAGHEAPAPACGYVDPPGGTWIQVKRDAKGRPDCIHPNEEGAVQIGKTVNFETVRAGR